MGEIVYLPSTEDMAALERVERAPFEEWAGSMVTKQERDAFFVRTRAGEYLMIATRAAWAAWLARALVKQGCRPGDAPAPLLPTRKRLR